jgi:hypothetical protein
MNKPAGFLMVNLLTARRFHTKAGSGNSKVRLAKFKYHNLIKQDTGDQEGNLADSH